MERGARALIQNTTLERVNFVKQMQSTGLQIQRALNFYMKMFHTLNRTPPSNYLSLTQGGRPAVAAGKTGHSAVTGLRGLKILVPLREF